jgi:prepilin-type N-terminal cleavage/methylation domain-containing protein
MCCSKLTGRFRNDQGFTLGELMATLALFSIVAAIAVPSYLSAQPGMRLNGGAREVLGKLMWARSKAVGENSTYAVTFPTNHSLQIFNDTNGNGSADAGEWSQTIDFQTDYSGVTLSKSGSDPTFNGRGTAAGSTTITVSNGSSSKTVTVSATGNVKIS